MALAPAKLGGGISATQPPSSMLAGRRASRLRGRGMLFEELRDYHPGDDVRRIDWRVTARTGRPHTRVYAEERERPVLLVVDQRLGMFFGTQLQMKSVTAAELAAQMAWQVLDAGDRVGALIFGDDTLNEIDPQRSRRTVLRILNQLVQFNQHLSVQPGQCAPPAPEQLDAVLGGVARRATHDWLVVIISDFQGISDSTRRHVQRIARHNDVIAAFVHDPVALQLPMGARRVLSDSRRFGEVDLADADTRQVITDLTLTRQDFFAQLRRTLGIPCLAIDTAGDVAGQLGRALGAAQGRQ
ncbi:DUF58 domain-containing protein [Candidatus Skiveiella danica]|uniref:DUF58 domain-containing protein n=1 Tax=Candidatus Skiveiella danica TaxID=3386177 RepID=UPI0039B98768